MATLLGFGNFDTTKGKKIEDNFTTAARGGMSKLKHREHRQYMNRKIVRKDGTFGNGSGKGFGGKGKGGKGGKGY